MTQKKLSTIAFSYYKSIIKYFKAIHSVSGEDEYPSPLPLKQRMGHVISSGRVTKKNTPLAEVVLKKKRWRPSTHPAIRKGEYPSPLPLKRRLGDPRGRPHC